MLVVFKGLTEVIFTGVNVNNCIKHIHLFQMRITMAFRKSDYVEQEEDPSKMVSSCNDLIKGNFKEFHSELLRHCGHAGPIEEAEDEAENEV